MRDSVTSFVCFLADHLEGEAPLEPGSPLPPHRARMNRLQAGGWAKKPL